MQKSKLKDRHTFNLDHMDIEHPKGEYKSLDSGTLPSKNFPNSQR